jgi:uncharacterized protein
MAVRIAAESGLLLKSTVTERELFVTLGRPRLALLIPPRFRDWVSKLPATAGLVTITERITACRDPKDDKFPELAVNGHADLIVSGDADLLALDPFQQIPIVTPAAFVQGWRDKYRRWVPHCHPPQYRSVLVDWALSTFPFRIRGTASRPPLGQGETKTRHLLGQFASLGYEVQISPLYEAA